MVSPQILDSLKHLNRSEKFYIVQFLISDLAEQETDLVQPGQAYPVWSPHGADEAAQTMLGVLQDAEERDREQH